MIDAKDLDYCALAEQEERARAKENKTQVELLNWCLKLLSSGQTTGMIYAIVKKKCDELSGRD